MQSKIFLGFLGGALLLGISCKKLVEVPEPVNTITTSETFSNDGNATSALVGIYSDMTNGFNDGIDWGNGYSSFLAGAAADELVYFPTSTSVYQFQNNTLQSTNALLYTSFWVSMYTDIYAANAVVMGLQGNTQVDSGTVAELSGEAKFLRAYSYFYLVNLFGNVPLVTTTAYAKTELLPVSPPADVYQLILSDLHSAGGLMAADYTPFGGNRYRANRWAAAALLARVYLYLGNWAGADSAASAVLANTGLYSLVDPNQTFLANSKEAIWQLLPQTFSQYATWEGYNNLPSPLNTGYPGYVLTPQLVSAFETGDLRWTDWVDSTNYSGPELYYSYKYKVQYTAANSVSEYYMMLRLAEQFLIRAEADAHGAGTGISGAISDLNKIRARANLPPYAGPAQTDSVLAAIMHERQIELFAEQGHRWMDLKRLNLASTVLGAISYKQPWSPDQLLWPIPISELTYDPNLQQNPGY